MPRSLGETYGMNTFPDQPFLLTDLSELGITRHQLRQAIAKHVVRRVLQGVYCRTDLPDTIDLRCAAARLVLPDHVVVSDRSAAWLHGIDCFDPSSLDIPPVLEVVSLRGHPRTRRSGVLGSERDLLAGDICLVNGIPVTTPLRTVADLACQRGRYAAAAVLDAFMRAFGLTHRDYAKMEVRFARRRGVTQFRELREFATALAESMGESWTRLAIKDAGLPVPRPQVWVTIGGVRYRLDLAYLHLRIVVEYDGKEFHSSDEQKSADRKRRRALRDAGWIVIVVGSEDFAGAALDDWLGELRDAIAERGPQAQRRYARAARPRRRQS